MRGTKWLVEDSCAGTRTTVRQGSVTVRHRNRTIIVARQELPGEAAMRRALVTLAALLAFAAPAQAEVINVTTTGENTNGNCPSATQCTLRAALALSRSNGLSTADTINLPAGEYLLNAELQTGTSLRTVAFVGAGADQTVIRGNGTRVLNVGGESWVILQGLTLTGGNPGIRQNGGNVLLTSAILQLDHVRITGGTATRGGGIASDNGTIAGTHVLSTTTRRPTTAARSRPTRRPAWRCRTRPSPATAREPVGHRGQRSEHDADDDDARHLAGNTWFGPAAGGLVV